MYTMTIIDPAGNILSQAPGYEPGHDGYHKDGAYPAPWTTPGGRYFHRTENDIRPALKKASRIAKRQKKTGKLPPVPQAVREKLYQAICRDPAVCVEFE